MQKTEKKIIDRDRQPWYADGLRFECTRCGEAYEHAFDQPFKLAFVASELDGDPDSDYEPFALAAHGRVRSVDLLEDELILQLPFAPRHGEGRCSAGSTRLLSADSPVQALGVSGRADNPFAALEHLKHK